MKRTAEQRLAELERQIQAAKTQQKKEERRKTYKVGEYVREKMANLETSPEFLAWLKTDIDRMLFGVSGEVAKPVTDKPRAEVKVIQPEIKKVVSDDPAADFKARLRARR